MELGSKFLEEISSKTSLRTACEASLGEDDVVFGRVLMCGQVDGFIIGDHSVNKVGGTEVRILLDLAKIGSSILLVRSCWACSHSGMQGCESHRPLQCEKSFSNICRVHFKND
jgi:hypothetical protein